MEPLKLVTSKKEWLLITLFISSFFSINLYLEFTKFKQLTNDEIYQTSGKIINIYQKEKNNIVKIETKDFAFFTSVNKDISVQKLETISFILVSEKIKFIDYLKGFFAPTFNIEHIVSDKNLVETINEKISIQHKNEILGELFNTLFFATPMDKELQNLSAIYGIAHVISISGFHLAIISFVGFFILNLFYSPIHQKYFPYRNKKFDSLIIITFLLFIYLIALNGIPSFLRSFIMFIIGILLLRSNIKIISFGSLGIALLLIISIFPKLLFSISLWFSVAGVFYIFLFIQYFNKLNKVVAFFFFNFWIFFAVNPITHYFFGTTALIQLLSPFITMGFIVFYPLEVLLHLLNIGDLLDSYLMLWLETKPISYYLFTPIWFFVAHIIFSFIAIWFKWGFYLLNISLILFNIYLYWY